LTSEQLKLEASRQFQAHTRPRKQRRSTEILSTRGRDFPDSRRSENAHTLADWAIFEQPKICAPAVCSARKGGRADDDAIWDEATGELLPELEKAIEPLPDFLPQVRSAARMLF
jgi:hypothetical protein